MTITTGSPSSSSFSSVTISSSSDANHANPSPNPNPNPNPGSSSGNPIQSWWESVSKAQSRIQTLASLLASPSLLALSESDRPAHSLLNSGDAFVAVSGALSRHSAGSGDDPLCQWLYETYQSSDPDLRLVVLSFVPLLAGIYLSRVVSSSSVVGSAPSNAGFEAVLLAIYGSEVKARGGKPLLISVPDLSQPSIYHTPSKPSSSSGKLAVGVISPPLEPQIAVKSTKRACIVGIALDCYYKKISLMPPCSKMDFCEFVSSWAGQDCPCRYEFDDEVKFSSISSDEGQGNIGQATEELGGLAIRDQNCNGENHDRISRRGSRVPLPWELIQPALRILGHCLLAPLIPQEVRDAASSAVRCVYARASHDIEPQVILAARSLIQLDISTRKTAKDSSIFPVPVPASSPSTPGKPRKPEVLLVSK